MSYPQERATGRKGFRCPSCGKVDGHEILGDYVEPISKDTWFICHTCKTYFPISAA